MESDSSFYMRTLCARYCSPLRIPRPRSSSPSSLWISLCKPRDVHARIRTHSAFHIPVACALTGADPAINGTQVHTWCVEEEEDGEGRSRSFSTSASSTLPHKHCFPSRLPGGRSPNGDGSRSQVGICVRIKLQAGIWVVWVVYWQVGT